MIRRYGFLVMVAVLLLAGYGKKDTDSAEQTARPVSGGTSTLKIGNTVSDIDSFNIAYREFEEEVEKVSEGRIQVELFTSDSIDETNTDVLDKVRSNTLQMGNTTLSCFADLSGVSEYYACGIPYLTSTDEELNTVAESERFMRLNKDFAKTTGVRVFDDGVNMGWFGFSAIDKKIHQIVDLKGMVIQINQTDQMVAPSEGAGINLQLITFSEVYTVLTQGTVDGMVTNTSLFYSNGFYDRLKSILTTHCGESYHLYIVSDKLYSSLPDDLRLIIDKNVDKLIARAGELEVDYPEETVGKMREKNIIVTETPKENEDMLRRISVDKVWRGENISLTSKENVKEALGTLGRTDEAQ